ncbi:MAG: hypothetical protein H0W62_14270 [Chitinophagales bacterium]|nr:hypothetical protein [Chitinophagales bacterium]
MNLTGIFVTALILISCRHQQTGENIDIIPVRDISPAQTVPDKAPSEPAGKTYKGFFVSGATKHVFRDCADPDKDIWTDDSGKLDHLYKALIKSSLTYPNEYAYTEVEGNMAVAPQEIRSRGYDSVLTVYKVLTFEQKNFRNSCIPYEFWVIGNKPNWSLQVSKKESLIALKDYTHGKVYIFPYFEPGEMDDAITYRTENTAITAALQVVIKKQKCSEGSSKENYEFSAKVIMNGKVYRGCAIRGDSGSF